MERTLPSLQRRSSTLPRRTVAVYASYAEAQRAVDYLSDRKFPVQRVAIVAEGLRLVGAGDRTAQSRPRGAERGR